MLGYYVKSRLISRVDGVGEVTVLHQGATLLLPFTVREGTEVSFRDPDESWEEKCRLQHIEAFIPKKDLIKLAVFMHFGGMYYQYDSTTGILHICHLSSRVTGTIALLVALLLIAWRMM